MIETLCLFVLSLLSILSNIFPSVTILIFQMRSSILFFLDTYMICKFSKHFFCVYYCWFQTNSLFETDKGLYSFSRYVKKWSLFSFKSLLKIPLLNILKITLKKYVYQNSTLHSIHVCLHHSVVLHARHTFLSVFHLPQVLSLVSHQL